MSHIQRIVSVLTISTLLSSCGSPEPQTPTAPEMPASFDTQNIGIQQPAINDISDMLMLDNQTMIISSETQGLYLQTQQDLIPLTKGQFEALGLTQANDIAVVDAEKNALRIQRLKGNSLTTLITINELPFQIDNFCFYTSPFDHNEYAFLLDGDGHVSQHLIAQKGKYLDKAFTVRQFFVGPDNNSCLANNQHAYVLFNESSTGLWHYPAEPESSLERQLLQATSPFGDLPAEFTSLRWLNEQQQLFTGISEETTKLYVIDAQKPGELHSTNLPATFKDAELKRLQHGKGNTLLIFNEAEAQILSVTYQQNTPAQDASPTTASTYSVTASVQTEAVDAQGDAADDPAIWYNAQSPKDSLILGTNKKLGLMVYDLQGTEVARIENGHVNNVDVRYGITLNGKTWDIAAASNRSNNSISLYTIAPDTRAVSWVKDIPTDLSDIYGLCMQQIQGKTGVWVNDKDGRYQLYVLETNTSDIQGSKVREFRLPSQPEGCVVNDKTQQLFAGEEDAGVWLLDLKAADSQPQKILSVNDALVADVEGVAIAYANNMQDKDYLLVSSQGDHSYVLFETEAPYNMAGKFRVTLNPNAGIDGSSETDGLEVSTRNFGLGFENGLLVVQDGYNLMPVQPQNFKYISWQQVLDNKEQ